MSLNEDYYERKYKRIQDILASTGGLIKFFFIIFIFLVNIISIKKYYIDLIDENFIIKDMLNNESPNIKLKSKCNINTFDIRRLDTKEKVLNILRHDNKIHNKIKWNKYFKLFLCLKRSKKDKDDYKFLSESIDIIKNML